MQSLVIRILRLDLDFSFGLIVFHKFVDTVDKCALDVAARLLPRLFFVVELESHGKNDQFVDV